MTNTADIRKYYDDHAHLLLTKTARHDIIFRQLKSIVRPGMTVLDLGCGAGLSSRYMAELGANVTAVDLSPEAIRLARLHNGNLLIEYIEADLSAPLTMIQQKPYDFISLIDCLEHIPVDVHSHVIWNIMRFSGPDTIILVNIPDSRFQGFLQRRNTQGLQIIDQIIPPLDIIRMFDNINYHLQMFESYGIDVPACQYNTMIFWKSGSVNTMYEKALKERMVKNT